MPERRRQLFHGLGGEICRGYYYPEGTPRPGAAWLLAKAPAGIRWRHALDAAVHGLVDAFEADLDGTRPSPEQWFDLFYWQDRCLRWGIDLMAGADLMDWHWTPFLDRHWVAAAWRLEPQMKRGQAFVEELAVALDPRLSGVPYAVDVERGGRRVGALRRRAFHACSRIAPVAARRVRRGTGAGDAGLAAFWRELLVDRGPRAWHDVLDPGQVTSLIETDPGAEVLWSCGRSNCSSAPTSTRPAREPRDEGPEPRFPGTTASLADPGRRLAGSSDRHRWQPTQRYDAAATSPGCPSGDRRGT